MSNGIVLPRHRRILNKVHVSHTPGPWHVEDPMGDICLTIVDDAEHNYDWKMVANVTWSESSEKGQKSFVSYKTAEANARLIAAAPELLEALKGLHERYVLAIGNEGPEAVAARIAIAKAQGETP